MVDQSDIEIDDTTEKSYRFQFRDREQFEELTDPPDWAQERAESISDGATVRMWRLPDSDAFQVESVTIQQKPNLGKEDAKRTAEKIVEEVQSG